MAMTPLGFNPNPEAVAPYFYLRRSVMHNEDPGNVLFDPGFTAIIGAYHDIKRNARPLLTIAHGKDFAGYDPKNHGSRYATLRNTAPKVFGHTAIVGFADDKRRNGAALVMDVTEETIETLNSDYKTLLESLGLVPAEREEDYPYRITIGNGISLKRVKACRDALNGYLDKKPERMESPITFGGLSLGVGRRSASTSRK